MESGLGYIALGSNLGDRARHLHTAIYGLAVSPNLQVLRCSPIYEALAHTLDYQEPQPAYLNAVVEVRTSLPARQLLALCQCLERRAGRKSGARWVPRQLDLDLLALGTLSCRAPGLTVPHPRLAERRFVLQPWADLSPNYYIGKPFDATVSVLLSQCLDQKEIQRSCVVWQNRPDP